MCHLDARATKPVVAGTWGRTPGNYLKGHHVTANVPNVLCESI